MMKHLKIIALSLTILLAVAFVASCGDPESGENGLGDGGDNDSNGSDPQNQVCTLNVMESFDNGMPAGWTVLSGGASGSGSGSGSGTTDVINPNSWHVTSTEAEKFPPPQDVITNMPGQFLKVGDAPGMNESLITGFYDIGSCKSVSLSFKQYFEDYNTNPSERGEVWILVDGPPWELVKTYNTTGYTPENIDLSMYVMGGLSFQVKFVYADENQGNWPWFIDDIAILGSE